MSFEAVNKQTLATLTRVRELVMAYGWNSTAYQIINPGIRHWFSTACDGVVGYVEYYRVRVVAGAPICALENLAQVIVEFENDATAQGARVCYFGAEARLEAALRNSRHHSKFRLGAQPVWHPQRWPSNHHASLRAQLHRARNKAITITQWTPEKAHAHAELHRCLNEWLHTRGLPPMHFLIEPQTLEYLFDRRIFVAAKEDKIIGFLVASPIPQRNGWLIEQTIRGHGAVNGMIELLIDTAVHSMAADASEYVTLGLSPLSERGVTDDYHNPLWLRTLLAWMRTHGRRFYNFEGLDLFKAKFQPEHWDPVFAIANEPRFPPLMLYAIAAAFTDGAPLISIWRAVGKAIKLEIKWLNSKR